MSLLLVRLLKLRGGLLSLLSLSALTVAVTTPAELVRGIILDIEKFLRRVVVGWGGEVSDKEVVNTSGGGLLGGEVLILGGEVLTLGGERE